MHGIMLRHLGHNVHILEKSPTSVRESQAAGIAAGPQVHQFFKWFDACKKPWFIAAHGVQVLDKGSIRLLYRPTPYQQTSWDLLYYRLRSNFDAFKCECYPEPPRAATEAKGKAFFDTNKRVTNVLYDGGYVTVEFENLPNSRASTIKADLVLVADGAGSIVSRIVSPA